MAIDELGTVCEFEAYIGNKYMKATIGEKQQVAKDYGATVASGHAAVMLDKSKDNTVRYV